MRTVLARIRPITNSAGETVRIVGMAQDITEQKKAAAELQKSEALLTQAEEIAELGSWEYHTLTKQCHMSPQFKRMFGFGANDPWDRERFWLGYSPQDQQRIRKLHERVLADGQPYAFTASYRRTDGELRYYQTDGISVQMGDGLVLRGTVKDVTVRLAPVEVTLPAALVITTE